MCRTAMQQNAGSKPGRNKATEGRQRALPAPHCSVFTGRMPFLPPNQQCQSTGGKTVPQI